MIILGWQLYCLECMWPNLQSLDKRSDCKRSDCKRSDCKRSDCKRSDCKRSDLYLRQAGPLIRTNNKLAHHQTYSYLPYFLVI